MKRLLPALCLCACVALLSGCVNTQITTPNGFTFKTTRFLFQGQIQHAEFTAPNGERAAIDGYTSDAAAVAKAVAEGITTGAAKAAKP